MLFKNNINVIVEHFHQKVSQSARLIHMLLFQHDLWFPSPVLPYLANLYSSFNYQLTCYLSMEPFGLHWWTQTSIFYILRDLSCLRKELVYGIANVCISFLQLECKSVRAWGKEPHHLLFVLPSFLTQAQHQYLLNYICCYVHSKTPWSW
jgi:hypothetical protein